jgi:hypothetical protein
MQEMDPVNFCQVAEIELFNINGVQRPIPRYWDPQMINTNRHIILSGHRVRN